MASGGIPWPWRKKLWLEDIQAQKVAQAEEIDADDERFVRGEE